MIREIRVTLALGYDAFKIMLASEPKNTFAITFDWIAKEQPFGSLGHYGSQAKLPGRTTTRGP